jgi:hypothetical protein
MPHEPFRHFQMRGPAACTLKGGSSDFRVGENREVNYLNEPKSLE